MGYTKRPGTEITDFQPDDTDTKMYFDAEWSMSLSDMLIKAKNKWPDASISQISIGAEHIHTHCLYYDRYDGSDWTNFMTLELSK